MRGKDGRHFGENLFHGFRVDQFAAVLLDLQLDFLTLGFDQQTPFPGYRIIVTAGAAGY